MKTVWKGPIEEGITQSLLANFLICRERFRLLVVKGLRSADEFNYRIEYGSMWHVCEANAAHGQPFKEPLKAYCDRLCHTYPLSQQQIRHWQSVCQVTFPFYLAYWKKHPDQDGKKALFSERVFEVPYAIDDGRRVLLRGRWDSVGLLGQELWLTENKTKGEIVEAQLSRQLAFDLQTMFYVTALRHFAKVNRIAGQRRRVGGVCYNVVRRPLSGGRHSIRPLKATKKTPAESDQDFYRRLGSLIAKEPEYFFMRWKVTLLEEDIDRFEEEFLRPVLSQLCDWWQLIIRSPNGNPFEAEDGDEEWKFLHYRTPYGISSPLLKGGSSELDDYLATGSTLGLMNADRLFQELDEDE